VSGGAILKNNILQEEAARVFGLQLKRCEPFKDSAYGAALITLEFQ
jgi:hypothetical protein